MTLKKSTFSRVPLAVAAVSLMVTPVAAVAEGGEGGGLGVADDGSVTLPDVMPIGAHYIPVDPLFVTIVDAGAMRGTLYIELIIDTQELEDPTEVVENIAAIRADLMATATDFASWYGSPGSPIDAEELEAVLSGATPEKTHVLIREVRAGDAFRAG